MITNTKLDSLKKEFLSDKNNIVRKRTLNKVPMVDLITDIDTEFEKNFDINIKTHGITDQKSSGRCWAFSPTNILREKVIDKCKLENFELSVSYVAFYDKLEKFNLAIERLEKYYKEDKDIYSRNIKKILIEGIVDGGYFTWYASLIDKYGIVPSYIFPENYQSSNTHEINDILSRLVRKFYLDMEKSKDIEVLKEKYIKDAYKIIASIYGTPVDKFDFEYTDKDEKYHIDKDLTPKTFYEKYIGVDLLNDYIEVLSYEDEKFIYNNVYEIEEFNNIEEYKPSRYLNLKKEELKDLILKQLKNNELVCFYSSVSSKRVEGIWLDLMDRYSDLFNVDLVLDGDSYIRTYGALNWGHAMIFTGAKTKNNEVIKWKVENSWGEKVGDKGYYTLTNDYFDRYVCCGIINKKYLTKEQLSVLDKKEIVISKFDYKLD